MKKSLKLWDIILMNVTAVIGLRWIPIAASTGSSSILLWILAVMLFFIPVSLIISELSTTFPSQGGLYIWVKEAYGEKPAFIVSWLYYTSNLFLYPSLLTFPAFVIAFLINPGLADSKTFIILMMLLIFWGITLFNLKGINFGRWISNLGEIFGILLPGIIIIILGLKSLLMHKISVPTSYNIPNMGSFSNLSFLSTLMFAMAGIEISPILAEETDNPQKLFPRAILISVLIIAGIYIIGTAAITFILPPNKIGSSNGLINVIKLMGIKLNLPWLTSIMAVTLFIGNLGCISIWIVVPVKLLCESMRKGIFAKYWGKVNKNHMPKNAMLAQALLFTIIILLTSYFPAANSIYGFFLLMTTLNYFIPYFFLFPTFIKLRRTQPERERPFKIPGGNILAMLITATGTSSILFTMIFSLVKSDSFKNTNSFNIDYILRIMGPILFTAIGLILNNLSNKKIIKELPKDNGVVQ